MLYKLFGYSFFSEVYFGQFCTWLAVAELIADCGLAMPYKVQRWTNPNLSLSQTQIRTLHMGCYYKVLRPDWSDCCDVSSSRLRSSG